jgi:hypothetical protein
VNIRPREWIPDQQNSPWPNQNRNGQQYPTLSAEVPCPSDDSDATTHRCDGTHHKDRPVIVGEVEPEMCSDIYIPECKAEGYKDCT